MSALRTVGVIVVHDLRLELRRPAALSAMLVFAAGATVVVHVALAGSSSHVTAQVAAGALWVVLLFAALLGIGASLAAERDERSFDALLAAPVDRALIYLGKVVVAAAVVLLVHLLLVPLFAAGFRGPEGATGWLRLLAVIAAADIGLAAVGVLVTALTFGARGRELLATVAFLPLTIPLLVASVAGTAACFGAAGGPGLLTVLGFCALYAAIFLAIGVATFPEIVVP